ncbi:MAG: ZIP family metal transporter [Candidatus Hodarchaeota archaeon]
MIVPEVVVIFYGVVAGVGTLSGIYIMNSRQEWAIKHSHYVNSFAAGLLLALVFFHLIPEAVELLEVQEMSELAFIAVFVGFFFFYLLENFIVLHSGSEIHYHLEESPVPHVHTSETRMGLMAFSGLAFHSLIDGVIIGVGFEISSEIGFLAAMAVILHEIPEGVTTFTLINRTIPEKAKLMAIIVALATPCGAVFSLLFVEGLTESVIGILLALAAGSFIYVAASDLIPETHLSSNFQNLFSFLLGAIVIYVISLI